MMPLLSTIFLLTTVSTLSAHSQLNAIVEKGATSDLSSFASRHDNTVGEFNSMETFLDGYLHRHSFPVGSSGCVGLLTISTVKLNSCRRIGYFSYEKTVATSTTITTTKHSGSDCVAVDSTIKKSYTVGVCNSQIFYSINTRATSELSAPRMTNRSDNYYRYRNEDYFSLFVY